MNAPGAIIEVARDGGRITVRGTLPSSGRDVEVVAYGPHLAYGGPQPATVNWSGIGSVSPGDAAAYAAMIVAAAEIAEAWVAS
jgi:hypothetical protein